MFCKYYYYSQAILWYTEKTRKHLRIKKFIWDIKVHRRKENVVFVMEKNKKAIFSSVSLLMGKCSCRYKNNFIHWIRKWLSRNILRFPSNMLQIKFRFIYTIFIFNRSLLLSHTISAVNGFYLIVKVSFFVCLFLFLPCKTFYTEHYYEVKGFLLKG